MYKEKDFSEKKFQEDFVAELVKYRWQAPEELNGNTHRVTVADLVNNWRKELNRMNADVLEGIDLTDAEFEQVLSKVNQIPNSYEAAKILSMEGSAGKIDGIYRDSHPNITRSQITLTILKKAQVSGGTSSYQVAREVQTPSGNRFDIVLLINGLPLINIEQKRSDKTLDEAYGQFKRYYANGEYTNNFMAFSQMMVVTSEIETRYFATPKSVNDFNPSFVFHWSVTKKGQEDGKYLGQHVLTNYKEVIEHFLMVPMAHQMIGDYLIIDEDPDNEENRRHMLMRPYQVYALQAVEKAAFGWDNADKVPHGGFVWHTTGSGKTITSFKTAQFLSTRTNFDKVVFLLDRRDLDEQTAKAFKAYATYESVDVDGTKSTYQLRKQLVAHKSGIVVTTTFKLSNLVKELIASDDYSLSDKKIIFIIDEAHRTTMGDMMGQIKDYFFKNGLFFGFTGTPLFDENNVAGKINERSEVINTTEKLFGPLLHQYTIDEAIADGNVLGFHVDYINTGEFKSYEDLREELIETLIRKNPGQNPRDIERHVQSWSELDVEKNAKKEKLLIYHDEQHIPTVVREILANWQEQSQDGEFNALLTVAYKKRVIDYYHEFKKQLAQLPSDSVKPNIAMTFSFGNENDPDNQAIEVVEEMFDDYAAFTGIQFSYGDKRNGEEAYFEDVTARAKRGGSGRNQKNIDILIVADQLLTGYDAKRMNTLYVDRSLELQGLIQAYSRTNRVFGSSKEFGTIINFQYPRITEETVNQALRLYGSGGSNSQVLVEKYETAVDELKITVRSLNQTLSDPTLWKEIDKDSERLDAFKQAFSKANKQLSRVQQYYEFSWDDEAFGIDEHTWMNYVGAYKNLFSKEIDTTEITIRELKGRTKLQGSQDINAQSIFTLIGNKMTNEDGYQVINDNNLILVLEEIQELSNRGEDDLAEQLKAFINEEVVAGHLLATVDFGEAFKNWQSKQRRGIVEEFSNEWGIDSNLLEESLEQYSVKEPMVIPYFDEITATLDPQQATNEYAGNKLKLNMELRKKLPKWLSETKQKYK